MKRKYLSLEGESQSLIELNNFLQSSAMFIKSSGRQPKTFSLFPFGTMLVGEEWIVAF